MPRDTTDTRPNIFPALRYVNGRAAVEWLAKAFGFDKRMVDSADDGSVNHAEMGFGPGTIMLGPSQQAESTNPWDNVKQGIYVYVENVDAHYARAKAAGATIVRELQDTPYGSREYSVLDFEGHLWSFGTYLPEA